MLRRRRAAQINKQAIPYGSTKVEYLESTGSQYINTNYIPTNNTGYFIIFQTSQTDAMWRPIFGLFNQDTSHADRDRLYVFTNPYPCLGWNKEIKRISSSDYYKTQIDCDYNFFNSRKVNLKTKSSIISEDFPTLTYLPSVTIYLFSACNASNFNNGGSMYGFISKFIITENNVIVCHLIPTLDSHNTPCMFDKVTRKMFYNSGRGQFIYPTTSTTYSLRIPQAEWAKMTDTGIHKIYYTPIGYEGSLEDYAIENGYKRLIETESPNEEGKYYSFKWVETDDTLTTEWFEIDPPQEEFFEENLDNSQIS